MTTIGIRVTTVGVRTKQGVLQGVGIDEDLPPCAPHTVDTAVHIV